MGGGLLGVTKQRLAGEREVTQLIEIDTSVREYLTHKGTEETGTEAGRKRRTRSATNIAVQEVTKDVDGDMEGLEEGIVTRRQTRRSSVVEHPAEV